MFRYAKKGDKVFDCILQEFGTVVINNYPHPESKYPISVKFSTCDINYCYKINGTLTNTDKMQRLFWDRVPLIIPPKKPLPKFKINANMIVWNNNGERQKLHFKSFNKNGNMLCFADGRTSWSVPDMNDTKEWEYWESWEPEDV